MVTDVAQGYKDLGHQCIVLELDDGLPYVAAAVRSCKLVRQEKMSMDREEQKGVE